MAETTTTAAAVPEYHWGEAPEHLRTRAQLAEPDDETQPRLRPAGPVRGYVVWRRGRERVALYDVSEAVPKRELTPRQREAIEHRKTRARTCRECNQVEAEPIPRQLGGVCWDCHDANAVAAWQAQRDADRTAAAQWAREALADPATVILDSETTSLDGYAVELAVIDRYGRPLLDTLVNPRYPVSAEATAIHGLGPAALADAPTFADIEPALAEVIHGRRVVIYNAPFDRSVLRRELVRLYADQAARTHPERHREARTSAAEQATAWLRKSRWQCAMQRYAEWYGDWSDYHQDYQWQPLNGGHRALGDCRATRDRLAEIAAKQQQQPPEATSPLF